MSNLPSGRVPRSSPRPSSRRLPLLGALMTGLLLLGTPAVSGAATKKKPAPTKKKGAPAAQKPDSPSQALYEDAAKLLRAKQYAEAETLAKRCIDSDPQFAECHMLRGAALAGETQWDEAADEYRTFLRLAPSHPLAPKVQQTLENYAKAKSELP